MNHWTNHVDDPAAQAAADAAAAAASAGQGNQGDAASLLQQSQGNAWLQEKFHVFKDGTKDLDIEASARKLATSYSELEKSRPATGTIPKSPAEYAIEIKAEGVNLDEVKADPLFKGIIEDAHKAGVSQEHLNFFLDKYFGFAPDLFQANAQLTRDEAAAELKGIWKDDTTMTKNLGLANRAVTGFALQGDATGSAARLMEKYGNDPDFLAFAAAVGAEMQEDTAISDGTTAATDWDSQVNAIKADPAYMDANHPQHKEKVDALKALYDRRYGSAAQRLGGGATRR